MSPQKTVESPKNTQSKRRHPNANKASKKIEKKSKSERKLLKQAPIGKERQQAEEKLETERQEKEIEIELTPDLDSSTPTSNSVPTSTTTHKLKNTVAISTDDEQKNLDSDDKKRQRLRKRNKARNERKKMNKQTESATVKGVMYLGHLPHGFFEKEIRNYFSQFGQVLRVRLSRSKKTGRSRGYAFVEFADVNVATIASEAMNGYLMHGAAIIAKVVPNDKVHPDTFKPTTSRVRTVAWSMVERQKLIARSSDPVKVAQRSKNIQKNIQRKKDRLAQLKFNYKFPTIAVADKND